MAKFYPFRQNNTFGRWDGPVNVIVEANSAAEANDRAVEVAGVYFDGCRDGRDCGGCGDRWHPVDESDATAVPSIYGDTLVYCLDGRVVKAKDWTAPVEQAIELLKRAVSYIDGFGSEDLLSPLIRDIRAYLKQQKG